MDAHLTPSDRNGPSILLSVPDPTDWDDTKLPSLHPVDAALRCQICKDFFVAPVITNCSHTFCSECIRRTLHTESICPVCRAPEQEYRLRKNPVVEDLVEAFQVARPKLLEVAREVVVSVPEEEEEVRGSPPTKRRATRSTRLAMRYIDEVVDDVEIPSLEDGLVSCPSCQKRMKEDMVNSHLDRCLRDEYKPSSVPSTKSSLSLRTRSSTPLTTTAPLQPLPKIAYAMINDKNLRNKLQILGIPTYGTRKNLTDRHTEWVTMWNANVDAKRPKSKSELLVELATWEKAHIKPSNQPAKAHWSDEKWQNDHGGQFKDLVAKARAGAKKKKEGAEAESAKEGASGGECVKPKVGTGEEGTQSATPLTQVVAISESPADGDGVSTTTAPTLGFGPVGPHMAEGPSYINAEQDFSHNKRKFNEMDGNTQVREAV